MKERQKFKQQSQRKQSLKSQNRNLSRPKQNLPKSRVPRKLLQNRVKSTSQVTGRNAVLEILSNQEDREKVIALYIEKDSEKDQRVAEILEKSKGLQRFFLDKKEFRSLIKDDARGVMLLLKAEDKDLTLKQALLKDTSEFQTVLLLNEVLYEQNLGAIVRTCEALGAKTLVLANRIKNTISPVVRRVSMGATERINIVNENLFVAIAQLKEMGFQIYAIETDGEERIDEIKLNYGKIAFVVGGEDKGVTSPLKNKCDAVIRIPMKGMMGSLNISVSVGITLYERLKQII